MSTNPPVTIGELIDAGDATIQTGPFGTQFKAAEYRPEGVPMINVKNIGFGSVKTGEVERVGSDTRDRLSAHIVRSGDIVFGRKGAVERHAFIRDDQDGWMQGSDCIRLRIASKRFLARYISYGLLTPHHRQWMMNQCSHGATMPSLNQDILRRIELRSVSVGEQIRVVSILQALDDLLENNLRRIEILEEMAQAIYREWFVNFRFPGHENAQFVASSRGPVPKSWSVLSVADLCTRIQSGSTPLRSEPEYWDSGTIDWYKTGELQDSFLLGSEEKISESAPARIFESGTILMAIYGSPTVGRLGIVTSACSSNQAALGLVPNPDRLSSVLLFYLLKGEREHFNQIAQGAAQQNISKAKVEKTQLVLPSQDLALRFNEHVQPMWDQMLNLHRQIANLRTTRDLLLPKLISGEIDVSELDIDTSWLAA